MNDHAKEALYWVVRSTLTRMFYEMLSYGFRPGDLVDLSARSLDIAEGMRDEEKAKSDAGH